MIDLDYVLIYHISVFRENCLPLMHLLFKLNHGRRHFNLQSTNQTVKKMSESVIQIYLPLSTGSYQINRQYNSAEILRIQYHIATIYLLTGNKI